MNDDSTRERTKGLSTLRRSLSMLTVEERGLFAIFHSDRGCDGAL